MTSFTNSRNIGATINNRRASGLKRLAAFSIDVTRLTLPNRMMAEMPPMGFTLGSDYHPLGLTRHQIASALDIQPGAVWRWTLHPRFPSPISAENAATPHYGCGRKPQYWDMEEVRLWMRKYVPHQRRQRHAFAWWVLEYGYGLWEPGAGYFATPEARDEWSHAEQARRRGWFAGQQESAA